MNIKKREEKKADSLKNKKAQMKLSFGMIFSIILIMAFLAFAFYAIGFILDLQKSAQLGQFIDNFREDIDDIWKSSQSSKQEEYNLPGNIDYICFVDSEKSIDGDYEDFYDDFDLFYSSGNQKNTFFYPIKEAEDLGTLRIEHINIEETTSTDNPYCIKKENGKIEMVLKKEFGENLVTITSN